MVAEADASASRSHLCDSITLRLCGKNNVGSRKAA